jgi:hypothetical protein
VRNTHNANTFNPYDANQALGDTSPTRPAPPKNKKNCGGVGQIFLAVITIAVTVITSGAAAGLMSSTLTIGQGIGAAMAGTLAGSVGTGTMIAAGAIGGAVGSIASQAVGVATGIQDKFSWNAVALAAVGGGVGGGMRASGFGRVTSAVASNVATQGVGMAIGAQENFSWAGVAAAGVGAAVGAQFGGDGFGASLVRNTASGIANAATRSLIEGSDFGDNMLAALPDILGQTIGEAIAGGMMGRGAGTTGGPNKGKPQQSSKQYQDERIGTNLYGIPEGFEDKAQLVEEVVVTASRSAGAISARAPLDGWWRGIDFTPELEVPATTQTNPFALPSSTWMQNIQALGTQPQRLPTYAELRALENAGGYAWEAGPTPFELWEQRQTQLGMQGIANSMTGLGATSQLGAQFAGADYEEKVRWGALFSGLEASIGGMFGAPALSSGASASMQAMRRSAIGRSSARSTSPGSPEEAYYIRINPAYPGRPDPQFSIDTSTFVNPVGRNAAGFPRDRTQFWNAWIEKNPESLSSSNLYRIQELGQSPKIDGTWLSSFPEHSSYRNNLLVHHHVGGGQYAIPVPYRTHRGSEAIWHGN